MVKHLTHTLQDSFEYEGHWWLPNSPEDKVAGRLTFDPERGARLSLNGSIDRTPFPENRVFHCDVINGYADGVRCTLIDNYRVNKTSHSGAFDSASEKLVSNLLILGECLSSIEQLQFASCEVSYDHLEEWITTSAFDFDFVKDGEKIIGYSIQVLSHKYFDVFVEVVGLKLSLSNLISGPGLGKPKSMTIENEAFVKMVPTNPLDLNSYRRLVTDLGHLIALLMGNNTWPQKVRLILPAADETDEHAPSVTVSAFYRLTATPVTRRLYRHYMPVDFSTFVSRLPEIVERWLNREPGLQSVTYLFFTALYNEHINLENKFLNLVHALESYHRVVFGGKYINQNEYETFREVIEKGFPSALPQDLKDALRARLKYGNEYSLRKRLTLLLNSLDNKLLTLVTPLSKEFIREFVGEIVDTRNYNVHFDEESKSKAMSTDEMFRAQRRLALLVRILLLRTLGFEDEQIYQMLHDKPALLPWD